MLTIGDFTWDGFFWSTSVYLPSWAGLQNRRGAYGSRDGDKPAGGKVPLVFAPEGRDDAPLTSRKEAFRTSVSSSAAPGTSSMASEPFYTVRAS